MLIMVYVLFKIIVKQRDHTVSSKIHDTLDVTVLFIYGMILPMKFTVMNKCID